MFNEHVDLLAEATSYSAALDSSFLEHYDSLDDMVHEMICESYEDMLLFSKFTHDADMVEAQMIVQQESVESIMAFQEGIYGKAKNFAKKIIDKIKIKWRKFCIWVNKKVVKFLMKKVAGMKEKADRAFDRITGDKPEVKYFSKSQSGSQLLKNLGSLNEKIIIQIRKTFYTTRDIAKMSVPGDAERTGENIRKAFDKTKSTGLSNVQDRQGKKYRAKSLKKDYEEEALGDLDSYELKKSMWDFGPELVKSTVSKTLNKAEKELDRMIETMESIYKKTSSNYDKDKTPSKKNHKYDINNALNAVNTVISSASAYLACMRKVSWAALKAAARARIAGGSSTSDYDDEDEDDDARKTRVFGTNP